MLKNLHYGLSMSIVCQLQLMLNILLLMFIHRMVSQNHSLNDSNCARPLIMRTHLPTSVWGHAILHAAALVRIRPRSYHKFSLLQLASEREPNISHLRTFGCAVYVLISPPQRTKMGPQRRLRIYINYESPSITKYLEPLMGDMFTARSCWLSFWWNGFPKVRGEETRSSQNQGGTTNNWKKKLHGMHRN